MEGLHLVSVKQRLYHVSTDKKALAFLELTAFKECMDGGAKEILREVIVDNEDCRRYFFDAFMEPNSNYTLQDLRRKGDIVNVETKSAQPDSNAKEQSISLKTISGRRIELVSMDEVNAVYWGVRPWALKLGIVNEIMVSFKEGNIIYPVDPEYSEKALRKILFNRIKQDTSDVSEWSLIHIPGFIKESAISTRSSIDSIKRFLKELKAKYPRLVMYVPSSTVFIDIRTPYGRQDASIRNSYLTGERGYISHLRINKHIEREMSAMYNSFMQEKYRLARNPFPPAASGIAAQENLYIPSSWKEGVEKYFGELSGGVGAKAFPIIGEYGTGKTVLLKGYLKEFFAKKGLRTFYFENPGVQFYDLANSLMRDLGRYEFSKALWERCKEYLPKRGQMSLFPISLESMLSGLRNRTDRENKTRELQKALKDDLKITTDEEVAYKLASMVVETGNKPYFEYRDFVAGTRGSLVAEREESKYFRALIKAVTEIYNSDGVGFLIDEFEDIAISGRMTRSKSYEYLATLRHLIDISEQENLWIVMAMTPEAATTTEEMNQALWDRFTHNGDTALKLGPLSEGESIELLTWWLDKARDSDDLEGDKGKLYPLPKEILELLEQAPELRLPRRLVRVGFFALAKAAEAGGDAPFSLDFVKEIINELYPKGFAEARNDEQQ